MSQLRGLEGLGGALILRPDQVRELRRVARDLERQLGLPHRPLGIALPDLELGQHQLAVDDLEDEFIEDLNPDVSRHDRAPVGLGSGCGTDGIGVGRHEADP